MVDVEMCLCAGGCVCSNIYLTIMHVTFEL